jgi:(S)-ureidoglycine aminohydrolase
MRLFAGLFIAGVMVTMVTHAQEGLLKSSVYHLPDLSSVSEKNLFEGSTSYFKTYEVDLIKLKPGNTSLRGTIPNDTEELLIVSKGKLRITIGKTMKVLGPGSIAFIMPGEKYKILQEGNVQPVFYTLKSTSKMADVRDRAKSSGGSMLINGDSIETKKTERGGRKDFFNRPTSMCEKFEMHVTILNEGLPSHAPHTHAQEEIILLMKGDATMAINNKDYEISTGSVVFLAAGDLHGIRNTGAGQCEYFAFQWK